MSVTKVQCTSGAEQIALNRVGPTGTLIKLCLLTTSWGDMTIGLSRNDLSTAAWIAMGLGALVAPGCSQIFSAAPPEAHGKGRAEHVDGMLVPAGQREQLALQKFLGEYQFEGGHCEVKRHFADEFDRIEINSVSSGIGLLSLTSDGALELAIDFTFRTGGRDVAEGPGVLASISPNSKSEGHIYSNQLWNGGTLTKENKTATVGRWELGEPKTGATFLQSITMSSRPFKFFWAEDPWQDYKSIETKILIAGEKLTLEEVSRDEMFTEKRTLTFRRK